MGKQKRSSMTRGRSHNHQKIGNPQRRKKLARRLIETQRNIERAEAHRAPQVHEQKEGSLNGRLSFANDGRDSSSDTHTVDAINQLFGYSGVHQRDHDCS